MGNSSSSQKSSTRVIEMKDGSPSIIADQLYNKLVDANRVNTNKGKDTAISLSFYRVLSNVLSSEEIPEDKINSLKQQWVNGSLSPSQFLAIILSGTDLGKPIQEKWIGKKDDLLQIMIDSMQAYSGGKRRRSTTKLKRTSSKRKSRRCK